MSRFFRNQDRLDEVRIETDLSQVLPYADAAIFAVRHQTYLDLEPDAVVDMIGRPAAIIDCFGLLDDTKIRRYFELGCEVKGLGRGHIQRIKEAVRQKGKAGK